MIKVNGRDYEWQEELTVTQLLQNKGYTYSRIVVSINNILVSKEEYDTKKIRDNDIVQCIQFDGGGDRRNRQNPSQRNFDRSNFKNSRKLRSNSAKNLAQSHFMLYNV